MYSVRTHLLIRNKRSTVLDCEMLVVVAQHVGWELVRERGVDRLERAAHGDRGFCGVDVHPAGAAGAEDLLVGAFGEVVDRLGDGWGEERGRERVGDDRAGGGHEVRGAGEPQGRLVGDVVAHLLALGGLGDDVTEAVGAEHPRGEPPTGRAERHEQHAQRGQQPHRPPAQALARRGLALGAPGRRHVDDDRAVIQTLPPVSTIQPAFLSPGAAVSPHPLRTPARVRGSVVASVDDPTCSGGVGGLSCGAVARPGPCLRRSRVPGRLRRVVGRRRCARRVIRSTTPVRRSTATRRWRTSPRSTR